MTLTEFKAISLARLARIHRELKSRHPDNSRIDFLVQLFENKITSLGKYNLAYYLASVMDASREFKEFEELMPDEETTKTLLRDIE